MLRYLILGLLKDGAARHGYALMKAYRDATGFEISVGNFYRELQRLVAAGWVAATANPPGADPRRTPYRITDAGSVGLQAWLGGPLLATATEHQDDVALRAFVITRAGGDAALGLLSAWKDELAIRGRIVTRALETARAAPEAASFAPLDLMLRRRLRQAAADLEFVEQLHDRFREWGVKAGARTAGREAPPRARLSTARRAAAGGRCAGRAAGGGEG